MNSPPQQPLPPVVAPNPRDSGGGPKLKKAFVPLGILGVLLLKFKAALIPVLKFFPVLLTTRAPLLLTIWLYAQPWVWWFALGSLLCLFFLVCGHLFGATGIRSKGGS